MLTLALPQIANSATSGADDEKPLLSSAKAVIVKGDFDAYVQGIPEQDRGTFLLDGKRINALLDSLYLSRVLANEARKMQLDANPLVKRQLELQANQFLAKLRLERLQQDTVYPDFEARALELYKIENERFTVPAKVHAMHILIGNKGRDREEAIKRVGEVRAMVVANEKSFEDLALEYSDDPSVKMNKGDLGFFAAGDMVKPFSDTAFALKEPGQVSEPVETSFGFHIIKLIEKKEGYKKPFESVRQDIIKGLQAEYLDNVKREYLNAIREDKGITADTEAILGLQLKFEPKAPAGAAEKKP
jgi:peptidyl-prolyl cis-trans isomerase C